MPKAESGKDRIKQFFLDNMGQVVTAKQIQDAAAPVSEWARRVRELRDESRWPISTNNDDSTLKPGEYRLDGTPPLAKDITFERGISQRLRAEVLDRNGFTCQSCGLTPGDIDPGTGRKVRLHVAHIVDKSLGGKDEASNLRTYCSTCNQGAKNITTQKPTTIWLLSQIRRSGIDEQKAVRDWLDKKYGHAPVVRPSPLPDVFQDSVLAGTTRMPEAMEVYVDTGAQPDWYWGMVLKWQYSDTDGWTAWANYIVDRSLQPDDHPTGLFLAQHVRPRTK